MIKHKVFASLAAIAMMPGTADSIQDAITTAETPESSNVPEKAEATAKETKSEENQKAPTQQGTTITAHEFFIAHPARSAEARIGQMSKLICEYEYLVLVEAQEGQGQITGTMIVGIKGYFKTGKKVSCAAPKKLYDEYMSSNAKILPQMFILSKSYTETRDGYIFDDCMIIPRVEPKVGSENALIFALRELLSERRIRIKSHLSQSFKAQSF